MTAIHDFGGQAVQIEPVGDAKNVDPVSALISDNYFCRLNDNYFCRSTPS